MTNLNGIWALDVAMAVQEQVFDELATYRDRNNDGDGSSYYGSSDRSGDSDKESIKTVLLKGREQKNERGNSLLKRVRQKFNQKRDNVSMKFIDWTARIRKRKLEVLSRLRNW